MMPKGQRLDKMLVSDNDDKVNNLRVKKDGVLHLLVPPK